MKSAEEVLNETWDIYKGYKTSTDCLTRAMKAYAKEALQAAAELCKGSELIEMAHEEAILSLIDKLT